MKIKICGYSALLLATVLAANTNAAECIVSGLGFPASNVFMHASLDNAVQMDIAPEGLAAQFGRMSTAFSKDGLECATNQPCYAPGLWGKAICLRSAIRNLAPGDTGSFEAGISGVAALGGATLTVSNAAWNGAHSLAVTSTGTGGGFQIDPVRVDGECAVFSAYLRGSGDIELTLEAEGGTNSAPRAFSLQQDHWMRCSAWLAFLPPNATVRVSVKMRQAGVLLADGLQVEAQSLPPEPQLRRPYGDPYQAYPSAWTPASQPRADDAVSWSSKGTAFPPDGSLLFWFRPEWPPVSASHSKDWIRTLFALTPGHEGMLRKYPQFMLTGFDMSTGDIRGRGAAPWGRFWNPTLWHQMVLSWDKGGGRRLYLDGEIIAMTKLESDRLLTGDSPTFQLRFTGDLDGDLEEVTVFRQPLTQEEIERAYVAGLQAAGRLLGHEPAIRITPGKPVEVTWTYQKSLWFPELWAQVDGSLLLRADARRIPYWNAGAYSKGSPIDVFVPAGTCRWFRSEDNGAHWAEREPVTPAPSRMYGLPDGTVLALGETATHKGAGVFETSGQLGAAKEKTFSEPFRAVFRVGVEPIPPGGHRAKGSTDAARPLLYLNRSCVGTADGGILISGYLLPKGEAPASGDEAYEDGDISNGYLLGKDSLKCRLFIFASHDKGHTWERVSEVWRDRYFPAESSGPGRGNWGNVSCDNALNGPSEACLLRTADRSILCAFRTDGALLMAASPDDGRTWSSPWMAGPDGVSPALVESGDLIALAYGRPDVNIAFSKDGGKTWFGFTDLFDVAGANCEARGSVWPLSYHYDSSTCHASLVGTGAGRFLLAYDTVSLSSTNYGLPRNQIRVVPITVEDGGATTGKRFIAAGDPSVERSGTWSGADNQASPYLCTRDPAAKARFTFDGTGIALVHPTFFDGGAWRVSLDGKEAGAIDLRTPNTWWGRRTLVAQGLKRGRHAVELIPEIRPEPRLPLMPGLWAFYEPLYPAMYSAAGRTRATLHGFEVW